MNEWMNMKKKNKPEQTINHNERMNELAKLSSNTKFVSKQGTIYRNSTQISPCP